jgi:hypothetical protein
MTWGEFVGAAWWVGVILMAGIALAKLGKIADHLEQIAEDVDGGVKVILEASLAPEDSARIVAQVEERVTARLAASGDRQRRPVH